MRKALFIGGVADGKMEDHRGERYAQKAEYLPLGPCGKIPVVLERKVDTYRQEHLYGREQAFEIYILHTMSVDEAIKLLINKYANK